MIAYKVKDGEVRAVHCEKMEYPLRDADYETIYVNSHYVTIEEAYEKALSEAEAWVKSLARDIQQSRNHTTKLESELADKCIHYLQIKDESESITPK